MQKLSRFIAAFAFLAVLAVPSFAAAPMIVKSGELTATINGVVKHFTAPAEIPAGAVLTCTSDAEVTVGAQTVTIPAGTAVQLANKKGSMGRDVLGVRVVSGVKSVTLTTIGAAGRRPGTTTLAAGSEVNVESGLNEITVVAGSATVNGKPVAKGKSAIPGASVERRITVYSADLNKSSIIPPPPPTQEKTVVSGSTPG